MFKNFKPEIIALVLAFGAVYFSNAYSFNEVLISQRNTSDAFKVLNAKTELNQKFIAIAALSDANLSPVSKILSMASAAPAVSEEARSALAAADEKSKNTIVTTAGTSTIVKPNYAVRPGLETGVYKVNDGDSPYTIASRFGVSVETVLVANNLNEVGVIKPGQELKIPSVTGIIYKPQSSDTCESLTEKFKLNDEGWDVLLNANDIEICEDLLAQAEVVIPQDNVSLPKELQKPKLVIRSNTRGQIAATTASAPANFAGGSGNFVWPTVFKGINQYFHRRHNGIDITCNKQNPGPAVYASDDGFVEFSGWGAGGWGNTIVINHGNGFKTRAAHLSVLNVKAGEKVTQGEPVGLCGSTGRSSGPHVHWTIYKNGVAVNPLSYVK